MKKYSKWSMWVNLVLPFCAVLLIALILVSAALYFLYRQQERQRFAQSVQKNAEFIRDMNLPLSETMAANMSRVLDVQIFFILENGRFVPSLRGYAGLNRGRVMQLAPGQAVGLGSDHDAVLCQIDSQTRMLVVRQRPNYLTSSLAGYTGVILAGMVAVVLMLGWVITRSLVRPLKEMAGHVPNLYSSDDSGPDMNCAQRNDEIGLLARTLVSTHERFLEERSARRSAERKAALTRVTASLAHEIRNPVAAASMQLQLLETSAPHERESTIRMVVPVIKRELIRVEKLLNQWMYLVNPKPSGMAQHRVRELVKEAIGSYAAMADHAQVEIEFTNREEWFCCADRMRLLMAFENIIRNAIQAMPGGGLLSISSIIGRIEFCDTGKGFSSAAVDQARDLFFTEREGGMGVGLTVADAVIEAHRGRLRLQNSEDVGARVVVELPPCDAGTEGAECES